MKSSDDHELQGCSAGNDQNDLGAEFDLELALRSTDGDPALLAELMDLFFIEGTRQLQELDAAIRAGDARIIRRTAHTLKSSISIFGGVRAAKAAARLEVLADQGDLGSLQNAWRSMVNEFHALMRAMGRPSR